VPDPGRVVRDLALPQAVPPVAVIKLFVLVVCDVVCWFVVCYVLYNYWQEVDSALYTN
jgi:hypothetical protein